MSHPHVTINDTTHERLYWLRNWSHDALFLCSYFRRTLSLPSWEKVLIGRPIIRLWMISHLHPTKLLRNWIDLQKMVGITSLFSPDDHERFLFKHNDSSSFCQVLSRLLGGHPSRAFLFRGFCVWFLLPGYPYMNRCILHTHSYCL